MCSLGEVVRDHCKLKLLRDDYDASNALLLCTHQDCWPAGHNQVAWLQDSCKRQMLAVLLQYGTAAMLGPLSHRILPQYGTLAAGP